jgi:hypothetical protein
MDEVLFSPSTNFVTTHGANFVPTYGHIHVDIYPETELGFDCGDADILIPD